MQYGLIGAGPVSEYVVRWLPGLRDDLGPVAAANSRLASRIVNTLRAGHALSDLSGLRDCSVILICAPGKHLSSLLPVLEKTPLDWRGKQIILCNCRAFSRDLLPLTRRGAAVASLRSISGIPNRLLVEGDRTALREARLLVAKLQASPVELDPACVDLFCSAVTFSNSLFTPVLESCAQSLRASGITGAACDYLLEGMFLQTLRAFLYSGRKSWTGSVAEGNANAIARETAALETLQPNIAEFYRSIAAIGARILTTRDSTRRIPNTRVPVPAAPEIT